MLEKDYIKKVQGFCTEYKDYYITYKGSKVFEVICRKCEKDLIATLSPELKSFTETFKITSEVDIEVIKKIILEKLFTLK